MKKPVYGFEKNYEIDDNGNLYDITNKTPILKRYAPQASGRQNRYRLCDKKYYDQKYLVYKSFYPYDNTIEVNDDRIIFINGNVRDASLNNLKIIDKNNRNEVAILLSSKYSEIIYPIPEYKNYYVSENGNIYSYYNSTSRLLKLQIGTDGYYQVKIPDNYGADYHLKVHRIVAEIFVENAKPNEYNVVHHKDENKLNNNKDNLEWTNLKQNTIYSIGKKCCMLDKNYHILAIFDSIADLSRNYHVDSSTASKQCNGKKGQFTNGWKARFFDVQQHNFIPTKFD